MHDGLYYTQELAALWSVEDLNEADVLRPEFRGERVVSRLTGDESWPNYYETRPNYYETWPNYYTCLL